MKERKKSAPWGYLLISITCVAIGLFYVGGDKMNSNSNIENIVGIVLVTTVFWSLPLFFFYWKRENRITEHPVLRREISKEMLNYKSDVYFLDRKGNLRIYADNRIVRADIIYSGDLCLFDKETNELLYNFTKQERDTEYDLLLAEAFYNGNGWLFELNNRREE